MGRQIVHMVRQISALSLPRDGVPKSEGGLLIQEGRTSREMSCCISLISLLPNATVWAVAVSTVG